MKNKIHKILGIAVTLALVVPLVAGFAVPVAAAETINEWYKFEYPVPGADGDWLYDPSITRVGEITEAIDGTLYVHVQRCVPEATFTVTDDPVTGDPGTVSVNEFGASDTGTIVGDIPGYWGPSAGNPWDTGDPAEAAAKAAFEAFLPTDFVAHLRLIGPGGNGTICIHGTMTATGLSFEGSIEGNSTLVLSNTCEVLAGFIDVDTCGRVADGGWHLADVVSKWTGWQVFVGRVNGLGEAVFKSTDGARTWEETDYPGGWVVDMAASSIDADSLYVADGYYVYKTDDAGDTWTYVKQDSLEEQLSGYCGVPACCHSDCGFRPYPEHTCDICPTCATDYAGYLYNCPITSIDVTYDDNENPYIFIGTRKHCSGIDLDDPGDAGYTYLDEFPGEVYWIGEAGFPSTWSGLGLDCYRSGTYDAIAVGCAPDWADTNETYIVVSTDDDNGNGTLGEDGDEQTHVVYTSGGPCDWPEVTELLYNCKVGNNFGSRYASRIAFPDDWEDTKTLFVGVVDCNQCDVCLPVGGPCTGGLGGDVYMVMVTSPTTPAIDMNVAGILSGCVGIQPVDICSLDIEGDMDEASLIAGSYCCNKVYCSEDGGWSWDASTKDPTGGGLFDGGPALTHVIWYEDTALAATAGCEAAVSMCCGEDYPCEFWSQISLISTGIDCVRDIGHSPGYVCGDSETMFMLTDWEPEECFYGCQVSRHDGMGINYKHVQSVWRYDGTYWERVYSGTIAGTLAKSHHIFDSLQVSPDFNETNVVYVWDGCFEMWRTTDAGCSWDKLTFPCTPRPCISAAVVIDEDTVIAGGCSEDWPHCCAAALGLVYKTTRHGARPWAEYEYNVTAPADVISFDLESDYEDPGSVLLGDADSRVFISEDGGEEWDLVGAGTTTGCQAVLDGGDEDTFVAFDPGYATNNTIYAAAGDVIARCEVDTDVTWAKQEWVVLCDHGGNAAGIKAVSDTALYVTDSVTAAAVLAAVTASGSVSIWGPTSMARATFSVTLSDTVTTLSPAFVTGEVLNVTGSSLIVDTTPPTDTVAGTLAIEGASSGATGNIAITTRAITYITGIFIDEEAAHVTGSALTATATAPAGPAIGGVLRSLNPLDDVKPTNKVIFERIANGLVVDTDPAQLRGLWLTCDTSDDGCAENVLWALDSSEKNPPLLTGCENIWVYEDTLAAPVVLAMPVDGRKLPTADEVTLSWNELCGAECYEVSLWKYCAECPDEKLAVDLDLNCAPGEACIACAPAAAVDLCACPAGECPCTTDICIVVAPLESGTTYYWQVRVCQCQPVLSKWSEERSFSTALLGVVNLCSPECGGQAIILTPNFSWDAVAGATGYDIEMATTETFTAGVVRGSSTVNAWVAPEALEYATTYYWRVRAEMDGVFSDWSVCIFTTMEKPEVAPPPVVVEPTPPAPVVPTPIIEFPPTPSWVWAIIGIGTALVVVVIVLTVRTRRPPA